MILFALTYKFHLLFTLFHLTRHTFGSLQVEAGTSIYVVQKMLAHKNVETTQIYANMADEQKRLSVNRITLKSASMTGTD